VTDGKVKATVKKSKSNLAFPFNYLTEFNYSVFALLFDSY